MNRGVPSMTQFPEVAYVFLKAIVRMIGTRNQSWIGSKKSIEVLVRVLNLGPDVVDQLTRELPLIEVIKYKAELLGLDRIDWDSVVLLKYATGWKFRNASLEGYIAALQQLGLISDQLKSSQLSRELDARFVDMAKERMHPQCRNSGATFTPKPLPIWKCDEDLPRELGMQVFAEGWSCATISDYLDCCLDIAARARILGKDPSRAVIKAFGVRVPKGRLPEVHHETFYTDTLYERPGHLERRIMIDFWPKGGGISIGSEEAFDHKAKERIDGLRCLRVPYVGYRYPE